MRTTAAENLDGSPSSPATTPFRNFTGIGLRRHQVVSLEPSSEEEFRYLDLLHAHLADSLKSLLPSPASASEQKSFSAVAVIAPFTLTVPFLHKMLEALLTCESDFKSLLLLVLSRNPSLVSRPHLDRAVTDLLGRGVKTLDLCNAISVSVQSLRHWNRNADIAASALHRAGSPSFPPQLSRARRALSKLLQSSPAGLNASSSTCRRMCRICSVTRHLHSLSSVLAAPRGCDSGSAAVLGLAVQTISSLLHFTMWVMVSSFPCGGGSIPPPPPPLSSAARQMPWASALAALHDSIAVELRRERKEVDMAVAAGMLAETLAVEKAGRTVMEVVSNGYASGKAAEELSTASRMFEEGLGSFEKKMREVFHRFVRWREEILWCLDECSRSASSIDSL